MPRKTKEVKDTPAQSWVERDKTVATYESSRREGEGEIPVELINRQPFDDFPIAHGVSRTNSVLTYKMRINTENLFACRHFLHFDT